MKKVIVASMLTLAVSLFAEVNLNDEVTADKIALFGLQKTLPSADKAAAGRWYLKVGESDKYRQVRNDEFELDGAIEEAYTALETKVKKSENYIGQIGKIRLSSEFKKYDFKGKRFPISIMQKNSYLNYSGKKLAAYRRSLALTFDNVDAKHAFLPMAKKDAKAFMKTRKHNGYVNRDLTARYTYTIKKVTTPIKAFTSCGEDFYGCDYLSKISVVGHITKLEILDKDETVLHTYSDYK